MVSVLTTSWPPQVVNTAIRAIQWMHNGNVCLLADDKGFARYLKANMSEINNFQIHDEPVRALRQVASLMCVARWSLSFSSRLIASTQFQSR